MPQLQRLPDGPFKQQLFIDLSLRSQLDVAYLQQMGGAAASQSLETQATPARAAASSQEAPAKPVPANRRIALSLPESILHVLLHYPHLHQQVLPLMPRLLQGQQEGELLYLVRLISLLRDHPEVSCSRLLGLWHGQYGSDGSAQLYALANREKLVGSEWSAASQLQDALERLLASIEKDDPLKRLIDKSRAGALTELEKHDLQRLLREKHTVP